MNQRIKECLAVAAILAYALVCVTAAFGHDSAQPHSHASQIVVSTTAFNNIIGITNNNQSNVTLQVVLDAMDNSTLPTASNIVVNTNNFNYFAPTNPTLQVLLDWQDDHSITNIDNTNIYMTSVQSSNAFAAVSGAYISASGGAVSNKHMAANAINSSNISDGAISIDDLQPSLFGLLRATNWAAIDVNGAITSSGTQYSVCGNPAVETSMTVSNIFISKTTLFQFWGNLVQNNPAAEGVDLAYFHVYTATPAAPTTFSEVHRVSSMVGSVTNKRAAGIGAFSTTASLTFVIPQSNYLWVTMSAGSTLNVPYTSVWELVKLLH